jgi:indolepyruvate ferredoxin oxidoreductase alpha subunit
MALDFLAGLEEVLVLEELDPVIEDELTRLCGKHHLKVDIRGKRSGDMPNAGENSPGIIGEKIEAFLSKIWVNISDLEKEDLPEGLLAEKSSAPVFASLSAVPPAAIAAAATAAVPVPSPSPEPPPLPVRPPVLCAGCPHRGSFFAVKEAVRKYGKSRKAVFSGDIGCYTLGNARPLEMVDTCLCMGAGITMAQGINRAESRRLPAEGVLNFAFIGDSTFFHTGIPGIVNAVYNRANIIVVILDNLTTAMTGFQPHPGMGKNAKGEAAGQIDIAALVAALGVKDIVKANPFDLAAADKAVKDVLDKPGVRVIIFEGPCIAVNPGGEKCVIDAAKCTGCRSCVKQLGCPAISLDAAGGKPAGKAKIDRTLCTGCGICKDLCALGAISGGAVKEGETQQ